MADGSLLLIFRSLTTDELMARRTALLAALASPYSSQTVGGKSFSIDPRKIQTNLEAIQFVLNERSCPYEGTVLTDFSQTPSVRARAGDEEQMS